MVYVQLLWQSTGIFDTGIENTKWDAGDTEQGDTFF